MNDIQALPAHALTRPELSRIEGILWLQRVKDPACEDFYAQRQRPKHALPTSLRDVLDTMVADDLAGCLITGLPVHDRVIGPTPTSWTEAAATSTTRREQIWLALLGTLLGDVMAYASLQDGRLVQHVLAMPGHHDAQTGHGQVELQWHTEDSFAPVRSNWVLLMGLRNPAKVATYVASVREVELSSADDSTLRQPRYRLYADSEHARHLTGPVSFDGLVPVITGTASRPHLRVDLPYMAPQAGDQEAETALTHLAAELDRVRREIILAPGDVLIINNRAAAHGRAPWTARWDGNDRWLLKVTAGDLSTARDFRSAPTARVLDLDHAST